MPFLLQAWSRFGLCLFPKWMDCVLSSAGSSGSLRPSACEHACDLYSGPLPVSDHNTHSQIWANEQNKCRRKMLYSWSTELLTWVILWKKAWNHQNAIPPSVPPLWLHMLLCGWAETVRLSIWPGGRSASPLWSSASRLCTNEQDSDPWGSHDHPRSALAHLTNDFFWQEMACVCVLRHHMTFVLPSVPESIFVAVWWQICADSRFLRNGWSLNEIRPPEGEDQLPAIRYCTKSATCFHVNHIFHYICAILH